MLEKIRNAILSVLGFALVVSFAGRLIEPVLPTLVALAAVCVIVAMLFRRSE